MSIQSIIMNKPSLAWYVADPANLSEESTVEHILQNGDWEDVQQLLQLKQIEEVAQIFKKTSQRKRSNYSPQIKNYFTLYFEKHA